MPIFFLVLIAPLFLSLSTTTTIPHHQQEVKAGWIGGFNCFNEPECVSGWDAGLVAAVTDWNGGLYTHSLNSGDYNCWATYSDAKCHGFLHAFIYEWTQLWFHEHKQNMTRTDDAANNTNTTNNNNTNDGWLAHTRAE